MPFLYFLDRLIGITSAKAITAVKSPTVTIVGSNTSHQSQSITLNSLAATNISVSRLKKFKLRVMLFLC